MSLPNLLNVIMPTISERVNSFDSIRLRMNLYAFSHYCALFLVIMKYKFFLKKKKFIYDKKYFKILGAIRYFSFSLENTQVEEKKKKFLSPTSSCLI